MKVRQYVRDIVQNEMGLQMDRKRLFYKGVFYPLNVVVFEDASRLGYFDSRFYELGLSKNLMLHAHERILKNVIRHELAHFMAYIIHGPGVLHGEEFKRICRGFNWDDEVEKAYANIEELNQKIEGDLKSEKMLSKLKKLLALTSSDNAHERELATLKANQLLLDHNLERVRTSSAHSSEEIVYVKRVLEAGRKQAKHVAIYDILKTFYISPIFNHGRGLFYLEVIGDKTSVELAEYVAHFLDNELEVLWKEAKKNNPTFNSVTARNSFFRGISTGYVQKIENQKKSFASSSELIVLEKNLKHQLAIVYNRIGHSKSHYSKDHSDAKNYGIKKGQELSIRPGLKSSFLGKLLLN
jgi:hypothetical protein